jgi:hypothetical protein
MAAREPLTTQLLHGVQWSRDLTWRVTLVTDARGNVHEVQSMCLYGHFPNQTVGHASQKVDPFDDLADVVSTTMVDSAISCFDQLVLFNQP